MSNWLRMLLSLLLVALLLGASSYASGWSLAGWVEGTAVWAARDVAVALLIAMVAKFPRTPRQGADMLSRARAVVMPLSFCLSLPEVSAIAGSFAEGANSAAALGALAHSTHALSEAAASAVAAFVVLVLAEWQFTSTRSPSRSESAE